MKATITFNNGTTISGTLDRANSCQICIDVDTITPEQLEDLLGAYCSVSQLCSGKWYVIAHPQDIKERIFEE